MSDSIFAVDTDCLIAALCSWHEHHEAAHSEIERRMRRKEIMAVAGHTLVEAYAVLTRLPSPYRLSPRDANKLIQENVKHFTVVLPSAKDIEAMLKFLSENDLGGSLTYDALILFTVKKSGAKTLLTFNERDFSRFKDEDVRIQCP